MIEIDKDDIAKGIKELKEQRKRVNDVIQPFLYEGLSRKQKIELYHVGKFITLLDKSSNIVVHKDSPDFIISYDGKNIGLEHERIFRSDKVEMIKSVTKLFDDAAELFSSQYPNNEILANCWLNTDSFSFKKVDADSLKQEIANYIYSLISEDTAMQKPSYIDKISLVRHSQVSFCYNPGAYMVSSLDSKSLEDAISKKEVFVEKYKTNSNLDRQWLLIVIDSTSPDAFELGETDFIISKKSKFERIYIMEDLHANIKQVV